MKRVDCLAAIHDDLAQCAVVTIMGAVAVELYSLGHRPNFFYLEHAMGLASSVGLGIALARPDLRGQRDLPDRRVVVARLSSGFARQSAFRNPVVTRRLICPSSMAAPTLQT